MAATSTSPDKRETLLHVLGNYRVACLHFDPRQEGVNIPASLRDSPALTFELGYDLPIPIPDLELVERGVFATLSFQGKTFRCFVPWESVYAVTEKSDGKGVLWPNDAPRVDEFFLAKQKKPSRPSHLRLVK